MKDYFRELSQKLFTLLNDDEVLLLNVEGEQSDFVRLNQNKIRQAGNVNQSILHISLIARQKQSEASLDLSQALTDDVQQAGHLISQLREQITYLPHDPYLHIATEQNNTEFIGENTLPQADAALHEIIELASGLDLVGIWSSGEVYYGFANSLGQFNWHSNFNFNVDWSVYSRADKAIKQSYSGKHWNVDFVRQKIEYARQTLPLLTTPPRSISPGHYRAFIAPSAIQELTDLLGWGGFGLKSHRTAQTPLIKMIEEGKTLDSNMSLVENHEEGLTPCFTSSGFIKPERITLIDNGAYKDCLANSRSAKEYDTQVNCDVESPRSLEMAHGELHQDRVLSELDTGIYISNLWYCNYSDRNNCRITGMTRFACLWVESGIAVAPLNVMRFDESIYQLFGDKLIALTHEREHIFDNSSYGQRSQSSAILPGALVSDIHLTL